MSIVKTHSDNFPIEVEHVNPHALISWRSVVAGFLVALFTMIGFLGLGLAIGGINMDAGTSAKSAGLFSGIWFLFATVVSLFAGSYFAARISKFRTPRIGSAQGLVIAALFLGLFLYQTIAVLGSLTSAAGKVIGTTGSAIAIGAQNSSNNSAINSTIVSMTENALGGLNLKSDPTIVAQGLGARILRGDTEAAKNYLALQAGLTRAQADARIALLKTEVDKAMADTKEATAAILKSTGWTLFSLVFFGAIAAVGGGALGSKSNLNHPLIIENDISFGIRV